MASGKSRNPKSSAAAEESSRTDPLTPSIANPPSETAILEDEASDSGLLKEMLTGGSISEPASGTIIIGGTGQEADEAGRLGTTRPTEPASATTQKKPSGTGQLTARSSGKGIAKSRALPVSAIHSVGANYVSALSANPASCLTTQTSAEQTTPPVPRTGPIADLSDAKAVWDMAMSMARAGDETEAERYFRIHAQIEASRKFVSETIQPTKRRTEDPILTVTHGASTSNPSPADHLPPGTVIEGGIVFIPGAKTAHTDIGLPAFFQKNIRELSGLVPLTIFDKKWQNMADSYHHDKKFKNDESGAVVQAWRGFPYPHEMTQSYAQWSVNFNNFIYALRHVCDLQRMASCAEAHRANVAYIHSRDNWMTAFRYDIAVRLNFFSHRVTISGVTSAIDISERRDDIAANCFADARRCDEACFQDNPYAEGQPRFGYDWNTGLPKVRNNPGATPYGTPSSGAFAGGDKYTTMSHRGHSNARNGRNNRRHNNSNAGGGNPYHNSGPHSSAHATMAINATINAPGGGGRGNGNRGAYNGRNYDPEYAAKKAASAHHAHAPGNT